MSEDVDLIIQPWPIVENAPFTVTCSTPSKSVAFDYSTCYHITYLLPLLRQSSHTDLVAQFCLPVA